MSAKKTPQTKAPKTAKAKKAPEADAAQAEQVQALPPAAEPTPEPAKAKGRRKAKAKAEPKAKKVSALDAAAKLLGEAGGVSAVRPTDWLGCPMSARQGRPITRAIA